MVHEIDHSRPPLFWRRWKWFVVGFLIILLFLIGVGIWAVPSALYGDSGPQEVREADRAVLVTIEDLDPARHLESAGDSCTRYGEAAFFGSVHLSYHYDEYGSRGFDSAAELSISSDVYVWDSRWRGSATRADNLWRVMTEWFDKDAARSGPDSEPVTVRMLDDLKLGDESLCAVASRDGKPVGFSFRCRRGTRILSVDVRGHGFDDRAAAGAFLSPHVDRLRDYEP
jgi:hypothetical protein